MIEDRALVRYKEKDIPDLQISLLRGKQILQKRLQGRPYFAPYPQILHFLEGIVANREENRNTREVISSTKILQDKKVKEQEFAKSVEKKAIAWASETILKQITWRESHCLAMSVKKHSGQE